MKRVAGGLVMCALLAGAIACTTDDPSADTPPSRHIAVDPDDVEKHEAASGVPISFGIDVPDGAVQVGPLVRQRRAEVARVIGGRQPRRAEAFENDGPNDKPDPATRDPEEPRPADFTTAMLRIDGEPSEVVQGMLAELADSLSGSEIDAEHWRKYCTVADGVFTGCRLHTRGETDDGEHVAVEFTVDPGNPATKTAPAGSMLRPVMVLTLERVPPPEEGDKQDLDPADAQAREAQAAIDAREAEERAKAAAAAERNKNKNDARGNGEPQQGAEDAADDSDKADDSTEDEDADKRPAEPTWPTMKREWPAAPGDWILTPKWKIRPTTEVILSSSMPQVAMLVVKPGGDADKIARRYIRAFADEATTPKLDEVEDRNELSVTYTPRNDGSGPSVAVTTVATGRGNYIELLFSDGDPTDNRDARTSGSTDGDKSRDESGDKSTAKRTTSSTD